MSYIGYKPADKPLTSADITDSIITSAKIVDGTIVNADIGSSAAVALSKLSTTGTANSTTYLRGDGAWTAVSSSGTIVSSAIATDSTTRSTTSSTFVTASNTLSVTVTPSSSSNKFLIIGAISGMSIDNEGAITLFRGSTNLGNATYGFFNVLGSSTTAIGYPIVYLDSPATTSSITYQIYINTVSGGGGTMYLNKDVNNRAKTSTFTVLEIKG